MSKLTQRVQALEQKVRPVDRLLVVDTTNKTPAQGEQAIATLQPQPGEVIIILDR